MHLVEATATFEMDFSASFGQDTVTSLLGFGFEGTIGGALIFAVASFLWLGLSWFTIHDGYDE